MAGNEKCLTQLADSNSENFNVELLSFCQPAHQLLGAMRGWNTLQIGSLIGRPVGAER
jgi:hypothetical protein